MVREALRPLRRESIDIAGRETLAQIGAALLSAAGAAALVANTAFYESFTSSHLMVVLGMLLLLYALSCPRLLFCREFVLYAAFVGYLFIAILWTSDVNLALNTLFPAVDFLLILLLFGSLFTFQDLRAVLAGTLFGFFLAAAAYTYAEGFPFAYPEGFSYNAMAGMYLFGLFSALLFGWMTRSRVLPLSIALILLVHIAATMSIKTNLGILFGAAGAGFVYFRQSVQILRRNALLLVVVAGAIAYAIASNDTAVAILQGGVQRVSVGLEVLQAREDVAGYSGYEEREYWMAQGLQGWAGNPVFGHGVEAFRADYGITSHSTPIDLLYNTGLIGFLLFYAMFASVASRLFSARGSTTRTLRALVLAGLLCNLFISLSATLFYQTFLAVFVAISTALLRRFAREASGFQAPSRDTRS